jgi:hypothetical protein
MSARRRYGERAAYTPRLGPRLDPRHGQRVNPRRRQLRRTAFLIVLAGAFTAIMGGSAQSYWTATGTGSGSGTTGTSAAVSISPGSPAATLHPGGRTDVAVVIANPNLVAVSIASLTLDTARGSSGFAVDATHAGCVLSTLSYTTQTNAGAGWSVPARGGGADGTLSITLGAALAMDVNAVDACQGAIFTIYLTAGS